MTIPSETSTPTQYMPPITNNILKGIIEEPPSTLQHIPNFIPWHDPKQFVFSPTYTSFCSFALPSVM